MFKNQYFMILSVLIKLKTLKNNSTSGWYGTKLKSLLYYATV